jgi:hypothetical protein
MTRRQLQPPPSVPANVNGENCIYLTSPEKSFQGQRLAKDGKPSREVGSPTPSSTRTKIQWA